MKEMYFSGWWERFQGEKVIALSSVFLQTPYNHSNAIIKAANGMSAVSLEGVLTLEASLGQGTCFIAPGKALARLLGLLGPMLAIYEGGSGLRRGLGFNRYSCV